MLAAVVQHCVDCRAGHHLAIFEYSHFGSSRMPFLSLIMKNLTRRPFRTGLTLLAFTTAVAAVVSLLGVANGFTESFAEIYESHAVDIVVSRQGSADRLSSAVDESFIDQIATLDGVAQTAGVLLETLSLEENDVYGIPTMGIAADSWLLDDYELRTKQSPRGNEAEGTKTKEAEASEAEASEKPKSLMLGTHLADRVGAEAGQTVLLFEEPYLVTGIFKSSSTWENGSMILPLAQLQELTDRHGQVTYINVVLDASVDQDIANELIDQIQTLDPKLQALTTSEFVDTDTRMRIASAMAWMTSMIALLIGAIGTLNTMMTSVLERTQEIGILRAIGWPRRRVVAMILMESVVLAVLASVSGCVMAVLLTQMLGQSEAARGILSPAISSSVLVQGFVLAMAIGLLGALIPAWRAARMLPTEAFRQQ
tara:strand:+ start:57918 stop:59192 length:1275 start_codon:yes stop_codon:yes gene_type:complete